MENIGYTTEDRCNRNGCVGIIEEYAKEGACSCHINPPCSYCVNDNHFCPICNWDGLEDQRSYTPNLQQAEYQRREAFYKKYNSSEPIEEYEARTEPHTHFTQIVIGVFPPTMSKTELAEKVKGTFGGRFERLTESRFKYIAYTD